MKSSFLRLLVVLPLILMLSLFAGCKPKEKQSEETPQSQTPNMEMSNQEEGVVTITKPAELEKAAEELAAELRKENPELEKVDAPIQMTYYFIRALQMDNQKALLGMLTLDAYRELAARPAVPCPEFIRNSEVNLGNVQYLSDENDETKIVGARVGTTWNVQTEEGLIQENIAWVFRFEDDAWLVAGMVSVLDPKYPPILINFEDLKETEEQLAELDKEIEKINADAEAAQQKEAESKDSDAETAESASENGEENAKPEENVSPTEPEESGEELPTELPETL